MAVRLDLPENALLRGGTVLVVLKVGEAQPPVAVRFLGSARLSTWAEGGETVVGERGARCIDLAFGRGREESATR